MPISETTKISNIQKNKKVGITYVEVALDSSHMFVTKVARRSGMWNICAGTWNHMIWKPDSYVQSMV